jgi:hypothetical protein
MVYILDDSHDESTVTLNSTFLIAVPGIITMSKYLVKMTDELSAFSLEIPSANLYVEREAVLDSVACLSIILHL